MKKTQRTTNAKLPRYNHYVPQFILENFSQSGMLAVLDKHTGKQFKLPPYRAMGERDFNNVRVGEAVLSFEHKFTDLEGLAAPVIARILEERSLSFLTPMDEATLHTFVIMQHLRSKRRRLDQSAIGIEIKRRWPEADLNPLRETVEDEEFEKLSSLNLALSKLDEFASILLSKHFYLLVKECPGDLYISDNPVVMHNSKDYGPYGNIGLAVPHVEIYYPLSAEMVLAYMCPLTIRQIEETHDTSIKEMDRLFASKFMSPQGLSISDRNDIEWNRAEIQRAKAHFAMIRTARLAPLTADNLLFLNSLQIMGSYRYVACRTSYFDFALRALTEKPHWKEGIGVKVA